MSETLQQFGSQDIQARTGEFPVINSGQIRTDRYLGYKELLKQTVELYSGCANPIEIFEHLYFLDRGTGEHSRDTAMLAENMSNFLNLDKQSKAILKISCMLHDMGKVAPDILKLIREPKRLSTEEKRMVSSHPKLAADALGALVSPFIPSQVQHIIANHHCDKIENLDNEYLNPRPVIKLDLDELTFLVKLSDRIQAITDKPENRPYDRIYATQSHNSKSLTMVNPTIRFVMTDLYNLLDEGRNNFDGLIIPQRLRPGLMDFALNINGILFRQRVKPNNLDQKREVMALRQTLLGEQDTHNYIFQSDFEICAKIRARELGTVTHALISMTPTTTNGYRQENVA